MKLENAINKASIILAYTNDYAAVLYKYSDENGPEHDWGIEFCKEEEAKEIEQNLMYNGAFIAKADGCHNEWLWRNRLNNCITKRRET